MENIDTSPQFKATSPCVASPTASHIASLSGARLQIRCLASLELVRNIPLPSSHDLRTSRLVWSPPVAAAAAASPVSRHATPPPRRPPPPARSSRVLVASDDAIRVYDLDDEKWCAAISNGSGGMGKMVHVAFGRTPDEVLAWSDFGSRLVVWSLRTGRTVEVRDPKYSGKDGRGWGYRPRGGGRGVLAVLCRCGAQDVLLLLAAGTYAVVKRVELQSVDAQGVRWSRDGRWIAVWDAPGSGGYGLWIYTADGHLYRTIGREAASDDGARGGIEGLGIKTVEWAPGNEYLAVGGWDRRVRILSTRTFAPVVYLDHTPQVNVPGAAVYTEQIDSLGTRTYALTPQPATPPKPAPEKNDAGTTTTAAATTTLLRHGISCVGFNKDGTLCATRDDSTPTTVWIWDLRCLAPKTILVQHAPVRGLVWHPHHASLLLVHTANSTPVLYLYTAAPLAKAAASITHAAASASSSASSPQPPAVLDLSTCIPRPHLSSSSSTAIARYSAAWLATPAERKPVFVLGHARGYVLVWPEGKDQMLRFEGQEGDDSDDSLYDILTGRKEVPVLGENEEVGDEGMGVEWEEEEEEEEMRLEDTFRGRGRGRSVLGESGLDEMF